MKLEIELVSWCWDRIDGNNVLQCQAVDEAGQPCIVFLDNTALSHDIGPRVIAHSTDRIECRDGISARIWDAVTADGSRLQLRIHRVAVPGNADLSQFDRELSQQRRPTSWVRGPATESRLPPFG